MQAHLNKLKASLSGQKAPSFREQIFPGTFEYTLNYLITLCR
ncbi:hypothetical protein BH18PSE1_BH18PSE1_12290 [soil metagenome]